jgi:NSS family neurotransmitter:Na+ symporter
MSREERWSGRTGFVLAAVSGAVGLGSIWKFPYEAGSNGGGAFILCYLAGLALIVLPLMLAEMAIGRRGRAGPAESLAQVARAAGRAPRWRHAGTFGVATGALILSFYSVIGGWTLAYAIDAVLVGLPPVDAASARGRFESHLAAPLAMAAHHLAFMAMVAIVISAGVASGIEAVCRVMMPVLVVVLAGLAVYALVAGDARAALRFLFAPDLEQLNARTVIDALGLGFFSIGVGLGFMVTYAAYADSTIDLRQIAIVTILADTAISFLAGLAIFPLVFAHGLDPASGPGLMFVSMPLAFASMPGGALVAFLFYGLLVLSALGSAISLLELVVAWLAHATTLSRRVATALASGACAVLGIATVLSFNVWRGWHPLRFLGGFEQASVFELIDYATSNLMLPIGGILFAVFAGRIMSRDALGEELRLSGRMLAVLRLLLRYAVPLLIAIVLAAPFLAGGR